MVAFGVIVREVFPHRVAHRVNRRLVVATFARRWMCRVLHALASAATKKRQGVRSVPGATEGENDVRRSQITSCVPD